MVSGSSSTIPTATLRPTSLLSSSTIVQLAQITPYPSPSCYPVEVIIHLSTTLLIPDYNRFYDTPVSLFQPSYYPLADGSLITHPFIEDLRVSLVALFLLGALSMLFARNIAVSGDYLRRGKVKKKILFYVLLISQLLGPVSLIPCILTHFFPSLNCDSTVLVSTVTSTLSLALLITGILGVKAYRCLENSRAVFASLTLFQIASTTVVAIEIPASSSVRSLTGTCVRVNDLTWIRAYVMIQFLESLFICSCFLFAIYKSHGLPATRGRISLRLSLDEPAQLETADLFDSPCRQSPGRRGWWDYVPKQEQIPIEDEARSIPQNKGLIKVLRTKWLILTREKANLSVILPSKSSPGRQYPLPETPRRSIVALSPPRKEGTRRDNGGLRGDSSPAPSSLARLMPRMALFRAVMKDELCYTAFITADCVIVATLAIVGLNVKNGLSVDGWIGMNWAIISILAIHSFGRVIRRHEQESILQNPPIWDSTVRANITAKRLDHSSARRRCSPPDADSYQQRPDTTFSDNSDVQENPFEKSSPNGIRRSWSSAELTSPSSPALADNFCMREIPLHSTTHIY